MTLSIALKKKKKPRKQKRQQKKTNPKAQGDEMICEKTQPLFPGFRSPVFIHHSLLPSK